MHAYHYNLNKCVVKRILEEQERKGKRRRSSKMGGLSILAINWQRLSPLYPKLLKCYIKPLFSAISFEPRFVKNIYKLKKFVFYYHKLRVPHDKCCYYTIVTLRFLVYDNLTISQII